VLYRQPPTPMGASPQIIGGSPRRRRFLSLVNSTYDLEKRRRATSASIPMKTLAKLIGAAILVVALFQFVRPNIPSGPEGTEAPAPPEVKQVLEKSCYACHSNRARLAWFDQVVPAYWLVRHDVLEARAHLNFSTLGAKPAPAQRATLFEAVNMIQLGAMPLPAFRKLHPEAVVRPRDVAVLKSYLRPWGEVSNAPAPAPEERPRQSLASVPAELNSFPFDPNFKNWQLLSTTDRGDNNTLRFILGNSVAFDAANKGQISPWPKGAKFAKIAWEQRTGADGLIHPGRFVQVELMEKDAAAYRDTEGWGWGRWRGLDLKPYGSNAAFVNECTGCHKPMQGDDYVYTLPITSAAVHGQEIVNNQAALPGRLPYQPLSLHPVTMYIDPRIHAMAILFADHSPSLPAPGYSPGSILALVTWVQRDDPHWFGGRIPDSPFRVEFVRAGTSGSAAEYRVFEGRAMIEGHPDAKTIAERTAAIAELPPAQLP
jgi:hypothetical protein